jgi:hypothetical protein
MTRIGTDNANKLFQMSKKIGLVIAGKAFYFDEKNVIKSTGWFIEQFKKNEFKNNWSIKETAEKLNDYLTKKLIVAEENRLKNIISNDITNNVGGKDLVFNPRQDLKVHYTYTKDGQKIEKDFFIESVSLIIAGIDNDAVGRAYIVSVPDAPSIDRDTEYGGTLWIGQTDIVARIIKGFDWEIESIQFVKDAKKSGVDIDSQLGKMAHVINWQLMTLQDSVDFCVLVTRITESIQRFSDGTVMNPGGITGVGGPIDVATITSGEGFKWISKKEVAVE